MKEIDVEKTATNALTEGIAALDEVKEALEESLQVYCEAAQAYADSFMEEVLGAEKSLADVEKQISSIDDEIKTLEGKMSRFLIMRKTADVQRVESEISTLKECSGIQERRAELIRKYVPKGNPDLYKAAMVKNEAVKNVYVEMKKAWQLSREKIYAEISKLENTLEGLKNDPSYPNAGGVLRPENIEMLHTSNRNAVECIADYKNYMQQQEEKARIREKKLKEREAIKATLEAKPEKPSVKHIDAGHGLIKTTLAEDGYYYDDKGNRYA